MASQPAILVLAPMPAAPASAGNRRRLVATCEALIRGGFAVDLAYVAHEDQIYRRFGQHPPTDLAAMAAAFRNVFLIEPRAVIPLKTRAPFFDIDDWCPAELGPFVDWYFSEFPETGAALVNYVFLSAALERVPSGVMKLIDTHDRFAGRQTQYRPFRAEPNFFYTDVAGEAAGLNRADAVLAIQAAEARYFADISSTRTLLLPPRFPLQQPFAVPSRVGRIGFLGHGNDPNLFSIGRFARAWAEDWTPDRPELVIAGEICRSLTGIEGPGVRLLGYLDRLADFYAQTDLVVAPMLMGSGLKIKVGEALSFGRPVIGTEIGLEGFEPEEPAHRCRDAHAVKAAVLSVVADREALARLTAASERLFTRYAAVTEAAEAELIALLRAHEEAREHPSHGQREQMGSDHRILPGSVSLRSSRAAVSSSPANAPRAPSPRPIPNAACSSPPSGGPAMAAPHPMRRSVGAGSRGLRRRAAQPPVSAPSTSRSRPNGSGPARCHRPPVPPWRWPSPTWKRIGRRGGRSSAGPATGSRSRPSCPACWPRARIPPRRSGSATASPSNCA
ncbi:glycosyltransferase [Methylorubrum suomiense]